jgi:hypothetical protein
MKLYKKIAQTLQARENCYNNKRMGGWHKHSNTIDNIQSKYFPLGDGFDGIALIDRFKSKENKIVIMIEWHCTDSFGEHDGMLTFDLIITPDLQHGFNLKIVWYSYKNNKHKVQKYKPLLEDFFHDTWNEILNTEYKE